jgi:hypothetical protein
MIKTLIISLILLATGELFAQTKILGTLPDSYKYDLSRLMKTKNKDIKDKKERKEVKKLKKQLKQELRISEKYSDLVSDSIAAMNRIKNNPELRQKFDEYRQHVLHKNNLEEVNSLPVSKLIKKDSAAVKSLGKDVANKAFDKAALPDELKTAKGDLTEIIQKDSIQLSDGKKMASNLIGQTVKENPLGGDVQNALQDSITMDSWIEQSSFVNETFKKEFGELDKMKGFEKEMEGFRYMGQEKKPQQPFLKGQDYMKSLRDFQATDRLPENIQKNYVDHFENHTESLDKAKSVASEAKKINSPKEILKSLFDQDTASVSGKTFKERLQVSGFAQISNAQPLLIDVMPNIGYRFTGRLTAGFGGQYRFKINSGKENLPAKKETHQSTIQSFVEYKLFLSFFLRTEYNRVFLKQNEGRYRGKDCLLAGLGRDFNYKNQLTGSVHLLFYVLKPDDLQANPLTVRLGFKF